MRSGRELGLLKQELLTRAAAQREEAGRCLEPWRRPLRLLDSAAAVLRPLRIPLALAGAAGAFLLLRRFPGLLSPGRLAAGGSMLLKLAGILPRP